MKSYNTIFNNQNQIFLGAHTLTLGGQYRYEKLSDNGNQLKAYEDVNKLTRWSWALFAEDEWAMTDSFTLTGGIRMESYRSVDLKRRRLCGLPRTGSAPVLPDLGTDYRRRSSERYYCR